MIGEAKAVGTVGSEGGWDEDGGRGQALQGVESWVYELQWGVGSGVDTWGKRGCREEAAERRLQRGGRGQGCCV